MSASVLVVCAGISWAGCGAVWTVDYGNEEACHRALGKMVVAHNGAQATGDGGRQVVALCRPPTPSK